MPNEPDDPNAPEGTDDDGQTVAMKRKDIRALESKGSKYDDAIARAELAERKLVFAQAGVDLDTPAGQIFFDGYKGDVTPEAVKAMAAQVLPTSTTPTPTTEDGDGNPAPVQQPPDAELNQGEAELTQQRQALAAGARGDDGNKDEDPYRVAASVHQRLVADGATEKEALGGAFNSVVNAAHRGDRRTIINPRSVEAVGG